MLYALPQTKRKCLKQGNEVGLCLSGIYGKSTFLRLFLHVTFVLCKVYSSGLLYATAALRPGAIHSRAKFKPTRVLL